MQHFGEVYNNNNINDPFESSSAVDVDEDEDIDLYSTQKRWEQVNGVGGIDNEEAESEEDEEYSARGRGRGRGRVRVSRERVNREVEVVTIQDTEDEEDEDEDIDITSIKATKPRSTTTTNKRKYSRRKSTPTVTKAKAATKSRRKRTVDAITSTNCKDQSGPSPKKKRVDQAQQHNQYPPQHEYGNSHNDKHLIPPQIHSETVPSFKSPFAQNKNHESNEFYVSSSSSSATETINNDNNNSWVQDKKLIIEEKGESEEITTFDRQSTAKSHENDDEKSPKHWQKHWNDEEQRYYHYNLKKLRERARRESQCRSQLLNRDERGWKFKWNVPYSYYDVDYDDAINNMDMLPSGSGHTPMPNEGNRDSPRGRGGRGSRNNNNNNINPQLHVQKEDAFVVNATYNTSDNRINASDQSMSYLQLVRGESPENNNDIMLSYKTTKEAKSSTKARSPKRQHADDEEEDIEPFPFGYQQKYCCLTAISNSKVGKESLMMLKQDIVMIYIKYYQTHFINK